MQTAQTTWQQVSNWFASVTTTYLTTSMQKHDIGSYAPKALTNTTYTQGLKASASMDNTALGVKFVTVSLDLYSNVTAHFNNGTFSQVWFQVQQPAAGARLLQTASNTTASWEGWMGVRAGQNVTANLTSGAATLAANKNLYGTVDLSTDVQHYTKFGGASALTTNASMAW